MAAEELLAAGLEVSGEEAILHTDGLGMQDLYTRRHSDALYFSVRIEPLLDITDGGLHTDWFAWANVAAVTSPLGDSTPFAEVRRMVAATAWRARPSGLDQLSFEPKWLSAEPHRQVTAAEALDVVANHVRGGDRRTAITLSGGWDSRLLAILARPGRRRMVAWTTSNDDGRDRDIEYAQQVAHALQLKHRVFVPDADAWLREHSVVRRRLNFQTTHHIWIMPLVRILHRSREQFVDGLGGDVLFKNLFVGREVVDAADAERRRRLLWNSLEQKRLQQQNLLAPGVSAAFKDLSRRSFDQAVKRFDGHPAAATLAVLHTRTARAIASSAQWLLGPEASVRLPFIHPEVITTALQVPLDAKVGGAFYRAMLQAANPTVAALPSTNDGKPTGSRGGRRQSSPISLRAMARSIISDEGALRILGPELRLAVKDPEALALISRSSTGLRVLHWVSLMGEWRARYASRLADHGFDPSA